MNFRINQSPKTNFKMKSIVVLLSALFSCHWMQAQSNRGEITNPLYTISIHGDVGFLKMLAQSGVLKKQSNLSYSFGALWEPGHLLNIGIESGFLILEKRSVEKMNTDFGTTNFKASLTSIPAIVVFNMKLHKLNLYGGLGASYTTSSIEAFDLKTITSRWLYTYYAALGYSYPFHRFGIGLKGSIYSFSKLNKTDVSIMLDLSFDVLNW